MIEPNDLAAQVKAWRGKVPAREAADVLGISLRTLQGVEQGRGFNYPTLLLIALEATKDKIREAS
jgi:hypothetical protein